MKNAHRGVYTPILHTSILAEVGRIMACECQQSTSLAISLMTPGISRMRPGILPPGGLIQNVAAREIESRDARYILDTWSDYKVDLIQSVEARTHARTHSMV